MHNYDQMFPTQLQNDQWYNIPFFLLDVLSMRFNCIHFVIQIFLLKQMSLHFTLIFHLIPGILSWSAVVHMSIMHANEQKPILYWTSPRQIHDVSPYPNPIFFGSNTCNFLFNHTLILSCKATSFVNHGLAAIYSVIKYNSTFHSILLSLSFKHFFKSSQHSRGYS